MNSFFNLQIATLYFFVAGCVSGTYKPSGTNVQSSAYWDDLKGRALEERIVPAPDPVVEYVLNDNIKNNFPNRPFRPLHVTSLVADVRMAVLSMPEIVRKTVAKKLLAIVLIEDLGSTGYSEIVRDEQENPVGGFIALDVKAIDRKANDWASWKENSPFASDGSIQLSAVIEEDDSNNRVQTIQYILLHEMGHILAIGENFHPPWDRPVVSQEVLRLYPFASVSWSFSEQERNLQLMGTQDGFGCYPLQYYAENPSASKSKALPCYRALEKTSFVSLYSGTNPFDDFAEAFAHYVHTALLRKPWRIIIDSTGNTYRYEPNWNEDRFKAKKRILDSLLPQAMAGHR